jgi:hypothetical protein
MIRTVHLQKALHGGVAPLALAVVAGMWAVAAYRKRAGSAADGMTGKAELATLVSPEQEQRRQVVGDQAKQEQCRQVVGDQVFTSDMMVVKVCSMGDEGTFEVTVRRDALVCDLVDAISGALGIANARRAVCVFVAGNEDPLVDTQSVMACMADAEVSELFVLLRDCNDRRVLEDIHHDNDGRNWPNGQSETWLSDTPIEEWQGVTVDESGNVLGLDFQFNTKLAELPASLGDLSCLAILFLKRCSTLQGLPESVGNLYALQELCLSGCSSLQSKHHAWIKLTRRFS